MTVPDRAQPVTHGPYSLVMSLLDGRMSICRQDPDHRRTVAFVDTMQEWDRFVAALDSGGDEVAAVHAIDAWHRIASADAGPEPVIERPYSPAQVACPHCGAKPGYVCKTTTGTMRDLPHKARMLAHPGYDRAKRRWT